MLKTLVLCLALFLDGCPPQDPHYEKQYTAQGYVRNVWCRGAIACDVVFQHDNGEMVTFAFLDPPPPLWAGLHCVLTYSKSGESAYYHVVNVKRIN